MDHHQSWYDFLPWYSDLHCYLQANFSKTVVFNGGILPDKGVFNSVHHIVAALLVVFILMIMSIIARSRLKNIESALIPPIKITVLNFFEIILDVLMGLMRDIIGPDYKRHVPLVGTLALFILLSNLLGLIPGFLPPTDNLNTTIACGLIVFIYFNYQGLKANGIGHFTHLANPFGEWWGWFLAPLFLPVELVGLIVRPFSLGIRLAGNMIGDHKVLLAFVGTMPLLLPIPFFMLGLLVSIIQTTVFCLLTCVYISLHTQEANH